MYILIWLPGTVDFHVDVDNEGYMSFYNSIKDAEDRAKELLNGGNYALYEILEVIELPVVKK